MGRLICTHMGPGILVYFDIGLLELLLGEPQAVSSPEMATISLKAVEVNKVTKTVSSKGCWFEGELKMTNPKRGWMLLT